MKIHSSVLLLFLVASVAVSGFVLAPVAISDEKKPNLSQAHHNKHCNPEDLNRGDGSYSCNIVTTMGEFEPMDLKRGEFMTFPVEVHIREGYMRDVQIIVTEVDLPHGNNFDPQVVHFEPGLVAAPERNRIHILDEENVYSIMDGFIVAGTVNVGVQADKDAELGIRGLSFTTLTGKQEQGQIFRINIVE